jgi:hypothetical protein
MLHIFKKVHDLYAEYPAVSIGRKLISTTPPETPPPSQCDRCLTCRQPIRSVAYPHVLNRQRRAARQLLLVVDNARAVVTCVSHCLITHSSCRVSEALLDETTESLSPNLTKSDRCNTHSHWLLFRSMWGNPWTSVIKEAIRVKMTHGPESQDYVSRNKAIIK